MQTRTKLALASTIVPIAFAVRALVRYADVASNHAAAEAAFERRLAESRARQAEAGAEGTGRDTTGCIDWAMANCHPGGGDCNACMDALRGCLATATVDEAACATIPHYRATLPPDEEAASTKWQKDQSAKYNLSHWSCSAMFKFVQLHCHPLK